MKKFRKLLSIILCLAMAMQVSALGFAGEEAPATAEGGFTADDFLKTKGRKIVNAKGEEIMLKGVNLGSWLIQEDWLSPYEEVADNHEIIETLIDRFGTEKAYELMGVYEDNWITEYDLDNIKALGFNCVRVPFWYRNFYSDDIGTKILDGNGDGDFVVERAALPVAAAQRPHRGQYAAPLHFRLLFRRHFGEYLAHQCAHFLCGHFVRPPSDDS